NNLFYDTSAYDLNFLEAGLKQHGVSQSLFGTEAPGSGGAPRPDTGRPHDDLVPVIANFGFLSEEDKIAIFNQNPGRLFPRLAEVEPLGGTRRSSSASRARRLRSPPG